MIKFIPIAVILYIIFLILAILYTVKNKKTFLEFFCTNLFVIFILLLINITLFPLPYQRDYLDHLIKMGYGRQNNFIPFASIMHIIKSNSRDVSLYQIGGNLCMLIPLGIYIPITFKKFMKFRNTLALGFAISVCIELIQFIINKSINYNYRSTDIDDIILNVIGVIIGYIIYLIIRPLYNKLLAMSNSNNVI